MDAAIALDGVTLRYRGLPEPLFERFTIEIGPGATTILGGDTVGKSSLLRLIAGLRRPRRGKITILGVRPRGVRRPEAMAVLGYVPKTLGEVPGVTVGEAVARAAWLKRMPRLAAKEAVAEVLTLTGLDGYRSAVLERAPLWVQRRTAIAQQLVHRPPVLLLDEPFEGLPAERREQLHALLTRLAEGRTIVLTARRVQDVLPGQVLILERGRRRFYGAVDDADFEALAPHLIALEEVEPEPEAEPVVVEDVEYVLDDEGMLQPAPKPVAATEHVGASEAELLHHEADPNATIPIFGRIRRRILPESIPAEQRPEEER